MCLTTGDDKSFNIIEKVSFSQDTLNDIQIMIFFSL